ncbi:hypothetical protein [Streptomyces sp. NPDC007083]|uniref:hypothetical protein n=1 Tax=Streptomyces sp. NPDC007083 TaxID=3156913 RepID=UPI00340F5861
MAARSRPAQNRAGTALTAAALVALSLGGCSMESDDPRALPGTGRGETLEKMLSSFGLQLPDCDVKGVRFGGESDDWGHQLLLRFRASEECVHSYLSAHSVDFDRGLEWPSRVRGTVDGETVSPYRPPFRKEVMETFGLSMNRQVTYEHHLDFLTGNGSGCDVLVDPRGDGETVYIVSTSTPEAF